MEGTLEPPLLTAALAGSRMRVKLEINTELDWDQSESEIHTQNKKQRTTHGRGKEVKTSNGRANFSHCCILV